MTPRDHFIAALECRNSTGIIPHFELVFFLTMEAFGRVHPQHRYYRQWKQMTEKERDLHRRDIADLHVAVAHKYRHAGIYYRSPGGWEEEDTCLSIEHARTLSDMNYLMMLDGDPTYAIPGGEQMVDFVECLAERPQQMKDEAQRRVDQSLLRAERIRSWGTVDGFCLTSDYAFNDRSFLSPGMFDEFVAPYLFQVIKGYRDLGFYVIKHTDGNIMPILDALIEARPHALHSIDPQGGMSLVDVKKRAGGKVCLIGNVNCALLQTGTDQEVIEDVCRALREGSPGGGYVFSTSNCIYTGMELSRYELMLDILGKEHFCKVS
jgi:uroporphyrinogen decarboxylase